MKKLRRVDDGIIGGVCGGIGNYFDIDPTIIRLLWLISVIIFGIGILPYIICWIFIPKE